MNVFELCRNLERKDLRPCYALVGGEHFLLREARRTICKTVVGDGHADAAVVEYTGDATLQEVLDELRTPSFFSSKKAVIVEDAAAFVSEHAKALVRYLKSPASFSCLVLILDKLDKRSALAKAVQALGGGVECGAISKGQLPGWIVRRASEYGKRIGRDAAELLVDHVGRDMAELDAQLANLASLVSAERTISIEHVRELVSDKRKRPIYELTDAVGKRQPGEALKVIEKLLLQNEPATKIIAVLAGENARMWGALRMLRRGKNPDEVGRALGVRPFLVNGLVQRTRRFSESDLSRNHRLLLKADIDSKTGASEQSSLLERLVIQLCN